MSGLNNLEEQFSILENLKDGWDGYGAYAPRKRLVALVREFVDIIPYRSRLLVCPDTAGDVDVAWYGNDGNVILSINLDLDDGMFCCVGERSKEGEWGKREPSDISEEFDHDNTAKDILEKTVIFMNKTTVDLMVEDDPGLYTGKRRLVEKLMEHQVSKP